MSLKIVIAALIAFTVSAAPLEDARELNDCPFDDEDRCECFATWEHWCRHTADNNSDYDYDQCLVDIQGLC